MEKEELNFGINPEQFKIKQISQKKISEKFIFKYKDKLQKARQKLTTLSKQEKEIVKKYDFNKVQKKRTRRGSQQVTNSKKGLFEEELRSIRPIKEHQTPRVAVLK